MLVLAEADVPLILQRRVQVGIDVHHIGQWDVGLRAGSRLVLAHQRRADDRFVRAHAGLAHASNTRLGIDLVTLKLERGLSVSDGVATAVTVRHEHRVELLFFDDPLVPHSR